METSTTLQNKIESILKKYPRTRNSDKELQAVLWVKYYDLDIEDTIREGAIYDKKVKTYSINIMTVVDGKATINDKFMNLPLGETVKRHRAFIQNNLGLYLPTSKKVAVQRRIKEEKIRDYYGGTGEFGKDYYN